MPTPERLRVWCEETPYNHRIVLALMEGAIAGSLGVTVASRAAELGLTARSAEGDAFETGWRYGSEKRAVGDLPVEMRLREEVKNGQG